MTTKLIDIQSGTYKTNHWENSVNGNNVTSDSGLTHHGNLETTKYLSGASQEAANVIQTGILGVTNRISFYIYFDDLPVTNPLAFILIKSSGGTGIFYIQLTTAGQLELVSWNQSSVLGTILSPDTWYRICVCWNITNATTYTLKSFLNGTLDGTITNSGTLQSASPNRMDLGWTENASGANKIIHTDDVYVDDSGALTDIGDIRVTAKRPAQLGTDNSFDTAIGSFPDRRDAVWQRAIDVAGGWQQAGSSQVQENYLLQGIADGDIDITGKTIVARCAWLYGKATAGGSGTPGLVDNGSVSAIVLTSSAAFYTLITDSASYPSNTAGIGMRSTGTTDDTFLYECGTVIAYLEPSGGVQRRSNSDSGARVGSRQ